MRIQGKKLICLSLALLTISLWLPGLQQETVLPPQEKHEVQVRLILVDVIATKDGVFFPGLKKTDFRIFEDGKEVEINSCDLVSLGQTDPHPPQDQPSATPLVVQKKRLAVLFDGLNVRDRDHKKAAQQVSDELVSLAKGGMEVMVLFLDGQGLRIVQPFTDQEAFIRAAAAKTSERPFPPFSEYLYYDDLLFMAREIAADLEKLGLGGVEVGPIYEMRAAEHVNSATDKLTKTVGGLLASLHMLENLPGRKNLLFVSSGFPDLDSLKRDHQYVLRGGIVLFDPFGVLGRTVFQTGEEVIAEIIRVANDRNISIYAYDPGTFSRNILPGASAEYFDREAAASQMTLLDERARQIQDLRILSEKTGAALFRGADKMESFREVVRNDLSYYYVLSYYPPKKDAPRRDHRIEVRLRGQSGIRIRFRKGYSDSASGQSRRLELAKAFYSPDLFRDRLPFRAEFIPFSVAAGKYRPWWNLALKAQEILGDRLAWDGKKTYELHFWIKEIEGSARVFSGQVAIPFDVNEALRDRLSANQSLSFSFVGPGLELGATDFQVVLALFDPETGEIGTWSASFPRPPSKGEKEAAFISGVLGCGSRRQGSSDDSFRLNDKDGALEGGPIRFFPQMKGGFARGEDVLIFSQVYYPQGGAVDMKFELTDQNALSRKIEGTKVAESWDPNAKVWSRLSLLDLAGTAPGDYLIRCKVALPVGSPELRKEIKLTIL